MAASPPLSAYTDVHELEDAIARLDGAAECLRILRLRAQTVDDVAEAQFALELVTDTIHTLHEWRKRKAPTPEEPNHDRDKRAD